MVRDEDGGQGLRYQSRALGLGLAAGLAAWWYVSRCTIGMTMAMPSSFHAAWAAHLRVRLVGGTKCRLGCRGGRAPLCMPYRAATTTVSSSLSSPMRTQGHGGFLLPLLGCWHFLVWHVIGATSLAHYPDYSDLDQGIYRKGGPLTVTDTNLLGCLILDYFPKIFDKSKRESLDA